VTEIDLTLLEADHYGIQVREGDVTTNHKVRVPEDLLVDLGLSDADKERLVRESFAFLLEREPATSILSDFSLDDISRYFPEYLEELRARLA
jgi:hypothetical protein